MSEYKAIEYFTEVDLKWSDFKDVPDDQKSALAISCFAVSEVNALMKQYAFADHALTGKPAIDYGILIHSHIILRTWSAKLFEFSEFITFRDKNNRTSDEKLVKLGARAAARFEPLKNLKGYNTARNLRHEASSHYLLDPVRKNLPFVSDIANCNLYLHQQNGNSHYPMGDEVVFVGRLNREASKIADENEKAQIYQEWWKWNLTATRWLHKVHYWLCKAVIPGGVGQRRSSRIAYWIDPQLVGTPDEVKLPIFLRRHE